MIESRGSGASLLVTRKEEKPSSDSCQSTARLYNQLNTLLFYFSHCSKNQNRETNKRSVLASDVNYNSTCHLTVSNIFRVLRHFF